MREPKGTVVIDLGDILILLYSVIHHMGVFFVIILVDVR